MGNPPTNRNRHEDKPEQQAGFKNGYEPSTREHPKRRVGNADRAPCPRLDMREKVRLTGQWRDKGEGFHLFINQAGPHIELLLAFVENGVYFSDKDVPRDKKRSATRLFRMGGDVDPNSADRNVYCLYAHHAAGPTVGKDLACGTLEWSSGGKKLKFGLDPSGLIGNEQMLAKLEQIKDADVVRFGDAPNFFENHLNVAHVPEEVRTMLWFPLTPTQAKALPRFIFEAQVEVNPDNYLLLNGGKSFTYVKLVERYFKIQSSDDASETKRRQWLANITSALDALVGQAYSDALERPARDGGIDRHHEDWWRTATLSALQDKKLMLEPGYPRSLLTHTQAILDGAPSGASLDKFERYLHLVPHSGGHEYEADIELKSTSSPIKRLPVGYMKGTLKVRKTEAGPFEATYGIELAGLNLSFSRFKTSIVNVKSSGEALDYGQAWRPEDIPGPVYLSDVSASAHSGTGIGVGLTFLHCKGGSMTAPQGSLSFNFSGLSDISNTNTGVGAGSLLYTGHIWPIKINGGDVENDLPQEDLIINYEVPQAKVHFAINGAGLTWDGCELLEIFAACELAALSRPDASVTVHGFADQPDKPLSNMILSRNRAITAYNYLKNILESDMATPELLLELVEEDEDKERQKAKDAEKKYREKHGEDPEVPIIVDVSSKDGRGKIRAHGEPKKTDPKEREKYDSNERRVEVHVGNVHLVMRRKKDN